MDVDAKTITQLVEWCQGTDMLVICRNDFILFLPVDAVADNVHPLTSIVRERDLSCVCVEQMGNFAACLGINFPNPLESICSQTALPPFFLHTFLHCLYDAVRDRTKGANFKVDT